MKKHLRKKNKKENEKVANQTLGNLGNVGNLAKIIPSFLNFNFSIWPYSQNRKLGFKNLAKTFPSFTRFLSFSSFQPGQKNC